MQHLRNWIMTVTSVVLLLNSTLAQAGWEPVPGNLMTRWAKEVSPEHALPEYPRPQMVRRDWQNLNGLWDYAITDQSITSTPAHWEGQILVPFPFESALSGVKKHPTADQRMWYRRSFTVPAAWQGQQVLLHFGAVDYDTAVSVNDKPVGRHIGGYDAFDFDITTALKPGDNEIVVNVYDSTSEQQPIGKQRPQGGGIFYTACSGIWQTVWLEPVPAAHISSFKIVPDIDASTIAVTTDAAAGTVVKITVISGVNPMTSVGDPGTEIKLPVNNPHLWTPEDPYLGELNIDLYSKDGNTLLDSVKSYFAMRKISLGKDDQGRLRIMLNNKFDFERGVLDQGYWPDGIYTAPTDDALKSDIELTKKLGFNLSRKHAKVEPDRWYYWCDKLGLLVWQDMPQAFANKLTDESARQWEAELNQLVNTHFNHPCIIAWTTFNEGWGEHDVAHLVDVVKRLDPTRLVNTASGWNDVPGVGDIQDTHHYPAPWSNKPEATRATVNGEFGGLGMRVDDHMWTRQSWGYQGLSANSWQLTKHYQDLIRQAYDLRDRQGMSAYVYTQLTDVETESNGLVTYDRAVIKPDLAIAAAANQGNFLPLPPKPAGDLLPASTDDPAVWQYTTEKPGDGWALPDFDSTGWKSAKAPFGHGIGGVNTQWTTGDIWLRREVDLPANIPDKLQFNCFHDEDVEIYINGTLAGQAGGYVTEYANIPMTAAGRAALKSGKNTIALHCHQTVGGQFIDVGITAVP